MFFGVLRTFFSKKVLSGARGIAWLMLNRGAGRSPVQRWGRGGASFVVGARGGASHMLNRGKVSPVGLLTARHPFEFSNFISVS